MSNRFPYSSAIPDKGVASPYYVMIGIPIAHRPCASHMVSLAATVEALVRANIRFEIETLQGCCHVDDARNIILRNFLQSDCTDLFFIDDDLGWQPNNVIRLLKMPGDIVAGIYCHKSDHATYPFHAFEGETESNAYGLYRMPKAATGFMRLRRKVVEALYEREKAKDRLMWLDGDCAELNRIPVARICERGFVKELGLEDYARDHASQSGDYILCLKSRQLGFDVFTDPDMGFNHSGEKTWHGHFGNHLRQAQGKWQPKFIEAVGEIAAREIKPTTFDRLAAHYGADGWPLFAEALRELHYQGRLANGDVLELGSGLSTLVLGLALASTDRTVHALEHDVQWWRATKKLLEDFAVPNVILHYVPLTVDDDGDCIYDFDRMDRHALDNIGLALIDGPPARYDGRVATVKHLRWVLQHAVVIVDDFAAHPGMVELLDRHEFTIEPGPRQWAVARPRADDIVMRHTDIKTEAAE